MKQAIAASRIVVVMPNWLGDGVMATPFLRALRGLYPQARIAAAARPLVAPVCAGLADETRVFGKGEEGAIGRWMRGEKFDLGVLLPNSFRSAWTMWRGGVKRRLGYARGGRSLLLTDRVKALRNSGEAHRHWLARRWALGLMQEKARGSFAGEVEGVYPVAGREWEYEIRYHADGQPQRHRERVRDLSRMFKWLRAYQAVPAIEYYLELARYLGAEAASNAHQPAPPRAAGVDERRMELHVSGEEQREADEVLAQFRITELAPQVENRKSKIENYAVIVPGANFGASKCWLPERFAAVAELLADPAGRFGAQVILAGSPAEMPICEAIAAAVENSRQRVHLLGKVNGGAGVSVGALKEIVRRARMMICNDTGPRHIAAAFGVPVVTLFGPTDPAWAETFFEKERIVRVPVPCGPCQLKACPIDHRCMKRITVEKVMEAVAELWNDK